MIRRPRFWLLVLASLALVALAAWAQDLPDNVELPDINLPDIQVTPKEGAKMSSYLQTAFLLMGMGLIPYIIVSTTSFIRVNITLSYTKAALGGSQALSNQLMMGISMIITLFIMYPVWFRVNDIAIQPYLAGDIQQKEFAQKLVEPIRQFMLAQTREKDVALFASLGGYKPKSINDVPFHVVMPSFIMSEVKTGFMIGFLIYLPFLLVDMIVASVLMSMGMFMLSPSTISTPFKLLLFVTIDGWHILILGLVRSFNRPDWMGTI